MINIRQAFFVFGIFVLSGCATTKYIPKSYFNSRHSLKVAVKPVPAASLIETGNGSDTGLLGAIISAGVSSGRAKEMMKTFAHIDSENIRTELEKGIATKIKDYYDVDDEGKDLKASITIHSWGFILPTTSFGISLGSYQLQIVGTINVLDMKEKGKEVAYTIITTQEQMKENMEPKETDIKVKKAIAEFVELSAEFLWRSADK